VKILHRIVFSMLSVVAIAGGVCAFVGAVLLHRQLGQEAEDRVRQDLNAAHEFYLQRLRRMEDGLRYVARDKHFAAAAAGRNVRDIAPTMDDVRKQAGVDILLLADEEGTTVRRSHRPELTADSGAMKPLLDSVLAGQDAASGTWLVAADDLAVEDPALAVRARIAVLPTPRAAPSREGALSEGMLMGAASAVRLPDGRRAGVLLAATLLNGNWDLVDQVRNVVFKDEKYEGRPVGTATLFQHDVRISTNVLLANGARAVGTRVSAEVGDEVLGRGRAWVGPAWVLDDWYISAYSPLHDVRGRPIGMIYVGVLQR
jgi:two-component system NtrC family sensor kinase